MKKTIYTAALATLLLGSGVAIAEDASTPPMGGMGKHHHRFEHMMEKMDTDKDGTITQAEHDTFTAARFKEMDANGDGKVTKEEMQKHHEEMMKKRGGKGHCEGKGKDTPPKE